MFDVFHLIPYILITAITPGPNNLLSMSNISRFGFRKSVRFNFGILCGFSIVMLICTFFSKALFVYLPSIKPFMLSLGAAYMLYLAYKTWRSATEIKEKSRLRQLCKRNVAAIYKRENIHLWHYGLVYLYPALL